MNSVLEQILATDTVKTPAGESLPLHSHIEANGGAFLQNVITQVKPKVSLEIGLAYGISALFICDALATLPTAHHIIIDPFQTISWHGVGLNNLRTANFGAMIDFREKFSHSALAELVEAKTVIGFAFDNFEIFSAIRVGQAENPIAMCCHRIPDSSLAF